MLRYYGPQQQIVLRDSKNIFRYWLATTDPYPNPADGYNEASESISEAIINFLHEGGVLESKMFTLSNYFCCY